MMPKTILLFTLVFLVGCGGTDSNSRIAFRVSLSQLPTIGNSQVFEGWAVVNGIPASTGRFVVDASTTPARVRSPDGVRNYGTVLEATFGPAATGLGRDFPRILEASHFFITIESSIGSSLRPSAQILLAGLIVGDRADLSPFGETGPGAAAALPDWTQALVTAMLTSPTGGGSPENGVWFTSDPNPPGLSSLGLQALMQDSFQYEAWVRDPVLSTWWSLGTFRDPARFDRDAQVAPTRGTDSIGLLTPGQDFVRAALLGGSMALDLTSGDFEAFVTLEPEADNAAEPFPLVLLSAPIPVNAVSATGRADRNVMMVTAPADLPLLSVQGSSTEITFTGRAPPSLGAATAGQYVIYLRAASTTLTPIRFTVSSMGEVRSFPSGLSMGTQSSFTANGSNTGLGLAFPNILNADEILIALEPQGVEFPDPATPVLLS
ncbi:MAG TPA: hypothetical protein PKA37_11150, partial [Planctomycetota bacterium]|nr:hypothetical protein [Planctomycetota bacterium]